MFTRLAISIVLATGLMVPGSMGATAGAAPAGGALPAAGARDGLIWIEGENAAKKDVHANPWFESVDPDELSGGKWLGNFSEIGQPPGTAEYDLDIPRDGQYQFWVRINPRGTGYLYALDSAGPASIDFKKIQQEDKDNAKKKDYQKRYLQETNAAWDGTNDARWLAWVRLEPLTLTKGKHALSFTLGGTVEAKRFGALDCLVLTTDKFEPNGRYKPGEPGDQVVTMKADESWPFQPGKDQFDPAAAVDWRTLNEKVAGETGFVKLSADGMDFVKGDGSPIRFWGGSDYVQNQAWRPGGGQMKELEHHARFLAKRGVNIVRLHGNLTPRKEGSKITDVDEDELDQAFRLVAAMKKEGIYTIISPYWGSSVKTLKSWNIPDAGNGNLSALVFFDPTVQAGYKAWVKELYTRKNPYTGIPLKDDAGVAIIQLQNEDSMLFWTMQGVKGQQLVNLRKLYAGWLVKKYGSLEKVKERWQGFAADDDDWTPQTGTPGMFIVWEFTRDARVKKGGPNAPKGREERLTDQYEFMCRTMYDFNAGMVQYLRQELGCKQLVNAGNWKAADQVTMDDGERWSYTATDVVGKNHYYSGIHNGINVGWQILAGSVYTDWSATLRPDQLPINVKQVVGHPFIIPESLWVPPLLYQAEGPLMVAAHTAMTGVDTFYWFANGVEEWQPPGNKWTYGTPMLLGQFPATALIYRRGYVKQAAEPVVREERSLQSIWDRPMPIIAEGFAWDPNRDKGDLPVDPAVKTPVDPLAFLVGPVWVDYYDKAGKTPASKVIDLSPYLDKEKKIVRSVTGEIELDYGKGLYKVDAPKAQGAAGFLKAGGVIALADVTITCGNDYAAIVVVPLDDKPIAQSGRVLVQVGTVCRPTGWKVRAMHLKQGEAMVDGFKILDAGQAPWQVRKTDATVTIKNPALTKATALDVNLMPVAGDIQVLRQGGQATVKLPAEALYLVLSAP